MLVMVERVLWCESFMSICSWLMFSMFVLFV